jgi:hypothetical protein
MSLALVVAENPLEHRQLQYVVRFPLPLGDLVVAARGKWPGEKALYCQRLSRWPADARVVEEIPLRSCRREGAVIYLLVDRAREHRSMVVISANREGREMIFWHSNTTLRAGRSRAPLPSGRLHAPGMELVVDSLERYPYTFRRHEVTVRRERLAAGDVGLVVDGVVQSVVERKTLNDFVHSLVDRSLLLLLSDLAQFEHAAVVVEGSYSKLLTSPWLRTSAAADLLAVLHVHHPAIPIVFCDDRAHAEDWTFRFLRECEASARALVGSGS